MNRLPSRRRFLQALAALGVATGLPARAQLQMAPRFAANPFALGIASGYPSPSGMVLWTRLAPQPDAPGGGMAPEVIPVKWEISSDAAMTRVVESGVAYAEPTGAHAVHVNVTRLQPGRPWWYRFTAGDAQSPVGRTRTAPAPGARTERLDFAFASCQQYEQGFYGAWRQVVKDDPDLVVFLGDYIYESSWGTRHVRRHWSGEPITLAQYRARHAQYKTDPDLQAAHAQLPWLLTWDDHEVENDYAGTQSENLDHPEWFLARRAAAYQAFFEHMPLPPWATPLGPYMRLHTQWAWGNLARFHILDDRQHRSPQACPRPGRGGSNMTDAATCAAFADPARTLLGATQEQWLDAGLAASRARWNIIAQQTLFSQWDTRPGPGRHAFTDGWDGYPAARQRLTDSIIARKPANPVFIGGDIHMSVVADVKRDFNDPASPAVASEFTGTSITSQALSPAAVEKQLADNPHVLLAEARYRGYTRAQLTPGRMAVDLRAMDSVATADAPCRTLASFVVEDGRPGVLKA